MLLDDFNCCICQDRRTYQCGGNEILEMLGYFEDRKVSASLNLKMKEINKNAIMGNCTEEW